MNITGASAASAVLPRVPDCSVARPSQSVPLAPANNLLLRIASTCVLAPLALVAAYLGGWVFALFWAIAALAVWWEWSALVLGRLSWPVFAVGAGALAVETVLAGSGRTGWALAAVFVGALAAALAAGHNRPWVAGGVPYASAIVIAPIVIRADVSRGFLAILFVFAVVWATDILGYFVGRAFGGPKLAPSISPNKTWTGAFGGAGGAIVAGAIVVAAGGGSWTAAALWGLILSVCAQAGDLFESKVKRLFQAKDASTLIPGHGGAMDRLDGFVAAATALAVFGGLRGAWASLLGW
jgi:phosphatidate cytidylyltransferase